MIRRKSEPPSAEANLPPEAGAARASGVLGPVALSESLSIAGEWRPFLEQLTTALYTEFNPRSPVEMQLTETIAYARWRLMRLWAFERKALSSRLAHDDGSVSADPAAQTLVELRCADRFGRSESRLDIQYRRALETFRKHRAWRDAQNTTSADPRL